jgi:lipoprotein-releasing system permease protein
MPYKHKINSEIAITYITTGKRLTLVAALGVTLGIAIYIFMNSVLSGFDKKSNDLIFRNTPHIRIYRDAEISQPLTGREEVGESMPVIINPKVVPETDRIIDPEKVLAMLRERPEVKIATPQVSADVFYNNGKSQISGNAFGVRIAEADRMFDIQSILEDGSLEDLRNTPNGILLGVGIAEKMSVRPGDNITVTSSRNVTRVMKVVGLFKTHNSAVDKTKSYININFAQQLLAQGPGYVTDINIAVADYEQAPRYDADLAFLTGYTAEDWQMANETLVAQSRLRGVLIRIISTAILLIAGFGIYNILNMTISQKIGEIAILKAMGFRGRDVIRIFVQQAFLIGLIGMIAGLLVASFLVWRLSKTYIGGDIGYFPIQFDWTKFAAGIGLGFFITLLAGYIPARKAANVDPVAIFRK